jgi:hypothetical protein
MLQLTIQLSPEGWDESKEEFVEARTQVLQLEHSLVSLSKWESEYCKPFLSTTEKTDEEILDYIQYMTLTQDVDPDVYAHLSQENFKQIDAYINAPMTATTFSDSKNTKGSKRGREIITAELIYYWMIALNINWECQYWHLNRLLTLVRVCNIKNAPPQKRSKRDIASSYAALNAARRKQFNSKG